MKQMFLILPIIITSILFGQTDSVRSGVYYWKALDLQKNKSFEEAVMLKGTAKDLSSLEVKSIILSPQQFFTSKHFSANSEGLIIVKEGRIKITIKDSSKTVGVGSIVLVMPTDSCTVQNIGTENAAFYTMSYRSIFPMDRDRGALSGSSSIIDWNDVKFKEHERGGIRQFFERPTVMTKRFEMHATTLKQGIKSHEPHIHGAEEIVLILNGNVEMQIGSDFQKASVGDVIYLASNVPHALKNVGTGSCTYFAFQWE